MSSELRTLAGSEMKRVIANTGLDKILTRAGFGAAMADDFRAPISKALAKTGRGPDIARLIDGLIDDLQLDIHDQGAAPDSELETPLHERPERHLADASGSGYQWSSRMSQSL